MIKNLVISAAFISTPLAANTAAPEAQAPKTKAPTTLDIDNTRLVKVIGGVDGSIIPKATELLTLADKSSDPIYIMINSPGGSVRAGNVFIEAMNIAKYRGIELKCVSPVYAASMAFTILMNCTERYALKSTQLLFHPVRVILGNMPVTAPVAAEIAADLNKYDKELKDQLLRELELDKEVMTKAYYDERWWSAKELQAASKDGWLIVVDDIKGTSDVFQLSAKKGTMLEDEYFNDEVDEYGYALVN
jgi:ATP-dependent Clp protease protease subunit